MKRPLLTISCSILFIIIATICGVALYGAAQFSLQEAQVANYQPTFKTSTGKPVDMEFVQIEAEVFLFVNKATTGIENLSEFKNTYEMIAFDTDSGLATYSPDNVIAETETYIKFGFDGWANVYCTGIFKNGEPVNFATGRLFSWLPAPSEAWMCEGIDIGVYPL